MSGNALHALGEKPDRAVGGSAVLPPHGGLPLNFSFSRVVGRHDHLDELVYLGKGVTMKKLVSAFAAAAFLAVGASGVSAQVQVGPTLALSSDDVGFGIGATVSAQAPALGEGFGFLGEFLLFFPDGFDFFEINGNVTYAFPLEDSSLMPFALAGLNISRVSVDVGGFGSGSSTDIGLNLGGGVTFDLDSFRPSVGARFAISDFNRVVVFATLPFEVGSN